MVTLPTSLVTTTLPERESKDPGEMDRRLAEKEEKVEEEALGRARPAEEGCGVKDDGSRKERETRDDLCAERDNFRAERDNFRTPTVKLKRKKSLREANITVTKGTHGVLERNKMLSKVSAVFPPG